MFYVEDNCNLTVEQLNFLQHVLSTDFPWYIQKEKNSDESIFYVLGHTLMRKNTKNESMSGTIHSPYYDTCLDIFKNFCLKNNIEVDKIFRAAFNCTFNSKYDGTRIHVDHEFEHKNFIFYVNEFTSGETCIYDYKYELVKQSKPKLHNAVVFSGEPHSHNFCSPNERRVILVITFSSK